MYKKYSLFLILLLTLITSGFYVEKVLLTGGLFPWQEDKQPIKETRIGLLPVEESLPFLVAQEKGYFSQKGLKVRLIFFPSAWELSKALASQRIDGMVGDIISAAQLEDGGTNVAIVSLCLGAEAGEGRFALLASSQSGIKSCGELAGVPVAVANNTISEYVKEKILTHGGIAAQDRKEVIIRPLSTRLKMLVNGQVKAAVLPDPLASSALEEGAVLLADDTQGDNISQSVLLFRQDVLEQSVKSVKKFMQAYGLAVQEINKKPERNLLVKKGIIPSNIDQTYKVKAFPLPQPPTKEDTEKVLAWLKKRGMVSTKVSYDNLVTSKFGPRKSLFGEN